MFLSIGTLADVIMDQVRTSSRRSRARLGLFGRKQRPNLPFRHTATERTEPRQSDQVVGRPRSALAVRSSSGHVAAATMPPFTLLQPFVSSTRYGRAEPLRNASCSGKAGSCEPDRPTAAPTGQNTAPGAAAPSAASPVESTAVQASSTPDQSRCASTSEPSSARAFTHRNG